MPKSPLDPSITSTLEEHLVPGHEYTVISLHPIAAWAVMFGGRDVESRSWAAKLRGRVLVHASGQRGSLREEQDLRAELSFLTGIARSDLPARFVRSAIMGSVEIVDCVEKAQSKWAVPEQQHWLLRDPRHLREPVTVEQTRLRFWRWTYDEEAAAPTAPGGRAVSGVYLRAEPVETPTETPAQRSSAG